MLLSGFVAYVAPPSCDDHVAWAVPEKQSQEMTPPRRAVPGGSGALGAKTARGGAQSSLRARPSLPQVCNKIIFLMSFVGNCGTFTRGYRAMVLDVEFLYHLLYLLICALGLFVHEFFYSLLVSPAGTRVSQRASVPRPAPPAGFSPHPGAFFS